MGFTSKILVSEKPKNKLKSNQKTGLQFFKSSIFKDGIEHP